MRESASDVVTISVSEDATVSEWIGRTLSPGETLGPYEIVAPIGAGGMGEVYRARDGRLDRYVAIKVVASHVAAEPGAALRLEREARAIAAMNHPNILALHDVGVERGILYAVMELLEGESLRERLVSSGPLPPRKAIEIAVQIADGLGSAHDRGIVHCDLKPENVFVTRDGHVKILDFGIARREVAASTSETTGAIPISHGLVGTPGYIAPEQIHGRAASPQSDIFALGIVLHEMLTGAHPFKRPTVPETLTAILRETAPSLQREVSDLPWSAARLVERCLEKQPEDRLRSARDLSYALQAIEASPDAPLAARAPSALRLLRARAMIASCGLLLVMAAAAWGYVHVMAERAVGAAVDRDLGLAQRLVTRVQDERLTRLRLTARLVASFPDLKALFSTDAATVRDFLLSYQQRNPGTPLLVALAPDGQVLARTDTTDVAPVGDRGSGESGPGQPGDSWLARLAAADQRTAVLTLDRRPWHAAAATAEAGGMVFGHVIAAAPVDETFAQELRQATEDEIVLLGAGRVIASTFRPGDTPWPSLEAWRRAGGAGQRSLDLAVGVQRFTAREVALVESPALAAVVARSRDEATEPFLRIERAVIVIGIVAGLLALLGSLVLARTIDHALRPRS
jgi:hypothetical protein